MSVTMENQNSISFGPINYASRDVLEKPYISKTQMQRIPLSYHVENKEIVFSLYYPNAKEVVIRWVNGELHLKQCNDAWTGSVPAEGDIFSVQVIVDGNEVLSPTLPIGFSCNMPFNYVDIPADPMYCIQDVPHGSICQEFVRNSVTGQWERIQIYLPAEYHTSQDKDYPVLYLQHGYGENESVWITQGKLNFLLDNLIAENKAVPMIVVMCCGMMVTADGSRSEYHLFDRFLLQDVIPYLTSRFRIRKDREYCAMAGLSMGSIQTSRTVLSHPDRFAFMGLFSGFLSDILSGHSEYLSPVQIAKFKAMGVYLYRAIGTEDIYFSDFENDSRFLAENGMACDTRFFSGRHEWSVWRKCIAEFVLCIFKNEKN